MSLLHMPYEGANEFCELFTWKVPPAARTIACIRLYRTSLDFVGEVLMPCATRNHSKVAINFIARLESG